MNDFTGEADFSRQVEDAIAKDAEFIDSAHKLVNSLVTNGMVRAYWNMYQKDPSVEVLGSPDLDVFELHDLVINQGDDAIALLNQGIARAEEIAAKELYERFSD